MAGRVLVERMIVVAVLAAIALVAACGETPVEAPAGQSPSPFAGVDTITDAETAARRVVDDTISHYLPDRTTRPDGLEQHPCDPLEDGEVLYDYVVAVDVVGGEVEPITREIWNHWQREYGFEPQSNDSVNTPPVVRAEVDGFRGSLTGDSEKGLIYVGVSSPCFPGED